MESKATTMQLSLKINGKQHQLVVNPRRMLSDVLRDDLGLTGTKKGCDDGTCGTCMVTVNGTAARACLLPVDNVNGKEVVTIEGLGTPERLHPLQEAFIEADAVQCGFCTPGTIMAAKALLDHNPAPTRKQIAEALENNLCRCTGYLATLDAVERAAEKCRGGSPKPKPKDQQRADALDKVLGTAMYAADLTMPGMLHGAVLRSPHAHAEVLGIDDSAARALPGVVFVATAKDVPGLNRYGRAKKDQRVFSDGRVRQVGDAVAAVAATSPEIAAEALSRIRVNYRPLPVITDPAEALKEGAPLIHDDGNKIAERKIGWGDVEAGFKQADVIVEETYSTPFIEHAYLEPESVLAYLDERKHLVVRSATQYSHLHRRAVSETMGLPPEQVRILPTVVGGAFGSKTDISCECAAALLVLKTGKPIKIVYSRAESFASTTKRHPFTVRCRTGVRRDGRVTAFTAEALGDAGAYASASPGIFVRAFLSLIGPYQFQNVAVHGRIAHTNNTTSGAMRGFGAPQMVFATESQMDLMAAKVGIDPLEFRLINRRKTPVAEAVPQDVEQETAFLKTIEAVRPRYETALRARGTSDNGRLRRGVGIACMRYGIGYVTGEKQQVVCELESDGRVRVFNGAKDLGQGTDHAWALIVSRELGLLPDAVTVISGDTDVTPDTGSSAGSRVIYTEGNAVKESAVLLKQAILSTASELLKVSYESLELRDGLAAPRHETGKSGPTVSLAEVARARQSAGQPLSFKGTLHPVAVRDALSGSQSPFLVTVSATHMAEVEVDTQDGTVRVLKVVAAHDVGRVIHAQGLKGQIDGAVSMGLGYALTEEFIPGKTTGFGNYHLPTAREMPEVELSVIELIDPSAPLGAKGVAECATVAVAPAITNAIANATGVFIHRLPATPERLLALIRDKG
jgi:aldehyde oxidoreductase